MGKNIYSYEGIDYLEEYKKSLLKKSRDMTYCSNEECDMRISCERNTGLYPDLQGDISMAHFVCYVPSKAEYKDGVLSVKSEEICCYECANYSDNKCLYIKGELESPVCLKCTKFKSILEE